MTLKRKAKLSRIAGIRHDYDQLTDHPGSYKTKVYRTLAERYGISERTVHSYVHDTPLKE